MGFLLLSASGLLPGPLFAAPDVAGAVQQGSLLVFPRIDAREGYNTIIRIVNNTSTRPISVLCHWMDSGGASREFALMLPANKPVYFDAASGRGTFKVASFPDGGSRTGELLCWAVRRGQVKQARWNYLSGSAEVIRLGERGDAENEDSGRSAATSYQYSAFAWYGREDEQFKWMVRRVESTSGILELNGLVYDYCGEYLVGHFTPIGGSIVLTDQGDAVEYVSQQLTWAACTQDLTLDRESGHLPLTMVFDVYNADGVKFSGARESGASWHEVYLDPSEIDVSGENFTIEELGTASALFRASSEEGFGLAGVLVSEFTINGGERKSHATTLNFSGTAEGAITWTPGSAYPESGQEARDTRTRR